MNLACIGLGSNLGQSRQLLLEAWQVLGAQPGIIPQALSAPCRTKPVGMDSPHWFINAAGLLRTSLAPEALLDVLLAVEKQFGRVRRLDMLGGYRDRTLDLDLLLLDEQVVQTERLILPHPALHKRLFTLAPLAEIAPQLRHPLLKKSIAELLAELLPQTGAGELERISWQGED
ncbi:MAG: 2-amino-4-hydroxy-6-hydroxymethyldihydropteridine diphosphokinase [Candidatus Electronema sp. V4]|uniref:2-amino-4-hydroxy-6- hydroxymethyldihydropteridine diphosphokinase n=1 Tax=Candidatus Electronema sp. V4 TaxID=3454756 RepID=UPI00405580D1